MSNINSNKVYAGMIFQFFKMVRRIMTAIKDKQEDEAEWKYIFQLMYHFRQSLACSICGRWALKYFKPKPACHWVCDVCYNNRSTQQAHVTCINCRNAFNSANGTGFEVSVDLDEISLVFAKSCKLLVAHKIDVKWSNLGESTPNGLLKFGELIQEGCCLKENSSSLDLGDKFRKRVKQKEHHCRCGSGAKKSEGRGPGSLTCLGQRCACYKESKACVNCKCVGCKNPNGTSSNGYKE